MLSELILQTFDRLLLELEQFLHHTFLLLQEVPISLYVLGPFLHLSHLFLQRHALITVHHLSLLRLL